LAEFGECNLSIQNLENGNSGKGTEV